MTAAANTLNHSPVRGEAAFHIRLDPVPELIDKDLQQCIKDEKYKQLIKTVDSDEKVCILKKEKSSDCPSAFLITVQSKEDTQLIWITGDMRKEDLEKLLKKL